MSHIRTISLTTVMLLLVVTGCGGDPGGNQPVCRIECFRLDDTSHIRIGDTSEVRVQLFAGGADGFRLERSEMILDSTFDIRAGELGEIAIPTVHSDKVTVLVSLTVEERPDGWGLPVRHFNFFVVDLATDCDSIRIPTLNTLWRRCRYYECDPPFEVLRWMRHLNNEYPSWRLYLWGVPPDFPYRLTWLKNGITEYPEEQSFQDSFGNFYHQLHRWPKPQLAGESWFRGNTWALVFSDTLYTSGFGFYLGGTLPPWR